MAYQQLTGRIPCRRPNWGAVPWHRMRKSQRKPLRFTRASSNVLFEHANRLVAVLDFVSRGAGTSARPGGKAVAVVVVRMVLRCVESGRRRQEVERCCESAVLAERKECEQQQS